MKKLAPCPQGFEHPRGKISTLETELSSALFSIRTLSEVRLSKGDVRKYQQLFHELESTPIDQQTIEFMESMVEKLTEFKKFIEEDYSKKDRCRDLLESVEYVKGFLQGRLLEKMNTADKVNIHRGIFGVRIAALLKALHIPDHFSR